MSNKVCSGSYRNVGINEIIHDCSTVNWKSSENKKSVEGHLGNSV